MAAKDVRAVKYTDDAGQDWAFKMDAFYFSQEDPPGSPLVGGSLYAPGDTPLNALPRYIKPRGVYVAASGYKRFVPCLTPTNSLYEASFAAGKTIDLHDGSGSTHTGASVYKRRGERVTSREPSPGQ